MHRAYAEKETEKAYEAYYASIEKFCRVRLGEASDQAGDCVQETFLVYYKRLLSGERFDNPHAFLYRTAHILTLKAKETYYKEAKRTKPLDDAAYLASEINDEFNSDLDYDRVKELLLSKLSESEQRLYEMKFAENRSIKEIAEILDIHPYAVSNRLSRLRNKIRNLVEPALTEFRKGDS